MREFDLRIFLRKYEGSCVDFFRFGGNYGDSVIWHGTMNLLSDLNITTVNVDITTEGKNNVLLIDGGGNFVNYYDDVRNFINEKYNQYKEIVFLPHTIFGDKQIEVLSKLKKNTTIFCRERESANFVDLFAKNCNVFLWHDCAFYNSFKQSKKGKGTLNAFRSDCESVFKFKPEFNIDISYNGYATKPLNEFLDTINEFEQINTDRLHVAITAVLLGKTVNLFSNSYFKNKAVYEYSLHEYFNISFINQEPIQG
jgi:exopolysaccharide biosynthesis predicted pyruvyltransferase EpsI